MSEQYWHVDGLPSRVNGAVRGYVVRTTRHLRDIEITSFVQRGENHWEVALKCRSNGQELERSYGCLLKEVGSVVYQIDDSPSGG